MGGKLEMKRIKALRDSCEDLRKETTQRRLEIKNLKDDLFIRHKRLTKEHKELEELFRKQEELKDELVRLQAIPIQLGKDMEKISRRMQDIEKKKIALREEAQELVDTSKKLETKCTETTMEKEDTIKEVEGKKALLESKEREFNTQTKVHEMNKENEGTAISERGQLEMSFRNVSNLKQKLHDNLSRMQREKEKDLRTFKKMEMQLKIAQESLIQVQARHERMRLEIDSVPKEDGAILERRRELQREVEIAKRNLTQEKASTESEVRLLEQCIAEEEQVVGAQEHYREELNNLIRMTQLKADEREQKSKDFLKAQMRLNNIIAEIKTKNFEIREHTKKQREIQRQMKEFAKLYDVVRHERNKLVSLVHCARQKTNEMKDKVKMLDNEMEILRNNAVIKERKLQKYQMKYSNNVAIKDSIQSDVCKVYQTVQEMKEKREQQLMDVERLTNTLTRIEEEMVQLRKTYEKAVQRRNESGVQLIEREEEVCIFYEKINIQEMMSRNGDIEINVMDEKIRYLKLKMIEKKRQIELSVKMLPTKRTLDADLVVLQIQFSQCKDRIKSLEKVFTDPDRENRVRALPGKDPPIQELFKKIEELEIHLTRKEERLLEKEFIYEQVSRMTEKISVKAENGKEETLILAKKMNHLQEKIKTTTQKIMALIAELSMHQAFAIKLQQEMRDKEQLILCIVSRLAKGLPPPKEIEQDWLRVLRDEKEEASDKHLKELQSSIKQLETRLCVATKDSKQLRSERTNLEKKIQELQTKCVNIEEEKYDAVAKVRDSMQLIEEANLQKSQAMLSEKQKEEEIETMKQAISQLLQDAALRTRKQVENERKRYNIQISRVTEELTALQMECGEKQSQLERAIREKQAVEEELEKVYREGRGNEADYRKLEELYQRCLNAERIKDDLHLSLQTAQNKIKQLELKCEEEKCRCQENMCKLQSILHSEREKCGAISEERLKLQQGNEQLQKEMENLKKLTMEAQHSAKLKISTMENEHLLKEHGFEIQLKEMEDVNQNSVTELRRLLMAQQKATNRWKEETKKITEITESRINCLKTELSRQKLHTQELFYQLERANEKVIESEKLMREHQEKVNRLQNRLNQAEERATTATQQLSAITLQKKKAAYLIEQKEM